MNNRHKWLRILFMFLSLLILTLFLLEIPRIYYRYEDARLLEEVGFSEYKNQSTKDRGDFRERAEKFLAYSSSKEPAYIEYSTTLSEELLYENVLQLVQELSLLLDGNCKVVLEELLVSYKEAHGFTVQFIYGDDYWDVGFFEFTLSKIGMDGIILYDVDTYKILWVEWNYLPEGEEPTIFTTEELILEYYEGMDFYDVLLVQDMGYVCITPFPEEVLRDKLLEDLYKLRERIWGVSEIEIG